MQTLVKCITAYIHNDKCFSKLLMLSPRLQITLCTCLNEKLLCYRKHSIIFYVVYMSRLWTQYMTHCDKCKCWVCTEVIKGLLWSQDSHRTASICLQAPSQAAEGHPQSSARDMGSMWWGKGWGNKEAWDTIAHSASGQGWGNRAASLKVHFIATVWLETLTTWPGVRVRQLFLQLIFDYPERYIKVFYCTVS